MDMMDRGLMALTGTVPAGFNTGATEPAPVKPWMVAVGAAASLVGLAAIVSSSNHGRVMVMCHGTRNAGFKRFLSDRPTFFTEQDQLREASWYASHGGIGSAQCSPCKRPRVDPAVLRVAVDPGRIMDLTEPDDLTMLGEVVADWNAENPLQEVTMDEVKESLVRGIPALPYHLCLHPGFRSRLRAKGYDSVWVKENDSIRSLAVLDARNRARIIGRTELPSFKR